MDWALVLGSGFEGTLEAWRFALTEAKAGRVREETAGRRRAAPTALCELAATQLAHYRLAAPAIDLPKAVLAKREAIVSWGYGVRWAEGNLKMLS